MMKAIVLLLTATMELVVACANGWIFWAVWFVAPASDWSSHTGALGVTAAISAIAAITLMAFAISSLRKLLELTVRGLRTPVRMVPSRSMIRE